MKLNKGKVHPSPSSSSSSSSPNDTVSTLTSLLPTAILTIITLLSFQDKEVVCYMITHSLPSTTTNGKKPTIKTARQSNSNIINGGGIKASGHKIPTFECGCFECYRVYWHRWDCSPNRELIHQAIEAFEEQQLCKKTNKKKKPSSSSSSSSSSRTKKGKRVVGSTSTAAVSPPPSPPPQPVVVVKEEEGPSCVVVGEAGGVQVEVNEGTIPNKQAQEQTSSQQHKGLARKVLPDVIGLFNSRLWNLWGPNV